MKGVKGLKLREWKKAIESREKITKRTKSEGTRDIGGLMGIRLIAL
ncbi:hypothetical protein ACT7C2_13745 [Bacillus pacificus]